MVQSCSYHQDSTTRNKDIQRKHIGTKGIIKEVSRGTNWYPACEQKYRKLREVVEKREKPYTNIHFSTWMSDELWRYSAQRLRQNKALFSTHEKSHFSHFYGIFPSFFFKKKRGVFSTQEKWHFFK